MYLAFHGTVVSYIVEVYVLKVYRQDTTSAPSIMERKHLMRSTGQKIHLGRYLIPQWTDCLMKPSPLHGGAALTGRLKVPQQVEEGAVTTAVTEAEGKPVRSLSLWLRLPV